MCELYVLIEKLMKACIGFASYGKYSMIFFCSELDHCSGSYMLYIYA